MYAKVVPLLALAGIARSHMHLQYPPTLKGDNNPYTKQGEADATLNYPYSCCGKPNPGPCKGYVDLLDTDEGQPVVTWAPGQKVNFTLSGHPIEAAEENPVGGTHYGGSCQTGFSVDGGKTFKVATTWQGNCPLRNGDIDPSTQTFDFTVPADLPEGDRVLFAWTWVNREKEFNMNCASVTIKGGSGDSPEQPNDEEPPASSAPPYESTPTPEPTTEPTPTQPSNNGPASTGPSYAEPTGSTQYTLEGCTCSCPFQTWSEACSCYDCKSPNTKRHLVERKVLALHRRSLQVANAPLRRAEAVAFSSRPDMLINIDTPEASCHSAGTTVELKFPEPGPDVVEGDGEYELSEPSCS